MPTQPKYVVTRGFNYPPGNQRASMGDLITEEQLGKDVLGRVQRAKLVELVPEVLALPPEPEGDDEPTEEGDGE